MFFVMGITDGRKEFDFVQTIICNICGAYGRYNVFMTYTVLSLFFIPIFKWNRRYYVKSSCCNTCYELDPEIGKRIAAGEDITITESMLTRANQGYNAYRRCMNCGFTTTEDFDFCPKCGNRL